MKNKRSLLSVLLVLGLLLTFASVAFAASFTDLQGHWAENQIQKWADQGLAGGYADGTFKPNNSVTRAEFVAMTNRAFNISSEGTAAGFSDVSDGQWFYSEVTAAKTAGYIGGYSDGTFKPNQSITRQEAASIVARLLQLDANTTVVEKFADANAIPAWSKGSIGALVQNGLMGGFPDNTFQPVKNITRAEALVSLDRALEFNPEEVVEVEVESAIEGAVTFEGRAYSGVTVQVFKADSYELLDEVKADTKGNFKVELTTGKYDLTATTSDKVAYLSDVVVTANKVATANLALQEAAIISGSVVDPKNADVKEATMAFTTNPTFVTETNKNGKFTVALLPNHTYTVRVYEPGEEDEAPDVVEEELEVGAAGEYTVEAFETSFTVRRSGGGGGPTGGGDTTPSVTIDEINDINAVVKLSEAYTLPTQVTAKMSNGTNKQVNVTWNASTVDTSKAGVFTFTGTVESYDETITLTLRVEAPLGTPIEVDKNVPIAFEGGITLTLDENTDLPKGTKVTATPVEKPVIPSGANLQVAGDVINFQFKQNGSNVSSVTATIRLEAKKGANALMYFNKDSNAWEDQNSVLTPDGYLEAVVEHFSIYGALNAEQVEAPVAELVTGGTMVALTTATEGATIHYTTDGSRPTSKSPEYKEEEPIKVIGNMIIKAIAIADNMKNSNVVTLPYNSVPLITEFTNLPGWTNGNDIITLPLDTITRLSGLKVSEDSTLALEIEGLGPFGDFELKGEPYNNTLFNIPILEDLASSASAANIQKIFETLRDTDEETRQSVISAVDFTALIEEARKIDAPDTKEKLKGNFENILNELKSNPDIKSLLIDELDNAIDAIEDVNTREEVRAKVLDLIAAISKGDELDFKSLIDALQKASETDKKAFINAIDFTEIFNTVNGSEEIDAIYEEISNVIVTIANDTNVSRSAVIDAINIGEDRETLFNWLKAVDNDDDHINIKADLTSVQSGQTNTYSIIIKNN